MVPLGHFCKQIGEQIVDVPVPQRVRLMTLVPQIACQSDATPLVSMENDVEPHMYAQRDRIDW